MTVTKRKSRPAQLADEMEAAGWTVERVKSGNVRTICAQHPTGEVVTALFQRNSRNVDVFRLGEHFYAGGAKREDVFSVAEVRKLLTPAVPFRLDAPGDEILAAVAGKTIGWRNDLTGRIEEGTAPRGGPHLKITGVTAGTGERVLSFPSTAGGWRAVRLDRIVKVR